MAIFIDYTPTAAIDEAMFNFDAFGISNYSLAGTVRVSVSDSFSYDDYLDLGFDSRLYTAGSNEIAWTTQQIANIQEIVGIYSQFANITFEWKGNYETGSDSTPNSRDIGQDDLSDININWIYRSDNGLAGISGARSDDLLGYTGAAGDIFLNSYTPEFYVDYTLDSNTRARQTLMHELGHSLGLSHPHSAFDNGVATITADYAATKDLGFDKLGFRTNSAADMYKEYFSIMSYDDQQSFLPGSTSLFHAHTPTILDVIALQQAYGEGAGTSGIGDDTITPGTAGYRTYFDKGGIDAIDLSLYTDGAYLQMGTDIGGAPHKVGVAMSRYDSLYTIASGGNPAHLRWFYGEYESANGGSNADFIIGNSLDNEIGGLAGNDRVLGADGNDDLAGGDGNDSLEGNNGNDSLVGGLGDDSLYGGNGSDTAVFSGTWSEYALTPSATGWTITGPEGVDTLSDIEYANFTDQSRYLANVAPTGAVTVGGSVIQNSLLTASNSIADADGLGTISYQWKAGGSNISGATASTLTLTEAQVGKAITVTASYTDLHGTVESVTSAATETVANVNDAPTLVGGIADRVAIEHIAFSFIVWANVFVDVDVGDTLRYSAAKADDTVLPAWLSFNPGSRSFVGTPGTGDIGTIDIKVTATDVGGLSATDTFALVVGDASMGRTVDFLAYDWRAHTLLDGVSITAGTAAAQTTGTDGSASFTGITAASLALGASRAIASADATLTDQAVNLQDAIEILKMIVGLEVNGAGKALSPYQALAADYDGNGQVQLTDAIGVLKHVVGLESPDPQWLFFDESDTSVPGKATLHPGTAPTTITADLPAAASPVHVGLVAYLSGDVDASFAGGNSSQDLDVALPDYFVTLTQEYGLDPAQFGLYA